MSICTNTFSILSIVSHVTYCFIVTKSIEHSADTRGDHSTVLFLKWSEISNVIERPENTIVANNSSTVINLVRILPFYYSTSYRATLMVSYYHRSL